MPTGLCEVVDEQIFALNEYRVYYRCGIRSFQRFWQFHRLVGRYYSSEAARQDRNCNRNSQENINRTSKK